MGRPACVHASCMQRGVAFLLLASISLLLHSSSMGRLITKQQLEARKAVKNDTDGLVLLQRSTTGGYGRDSQGVLIKAPSGLYRNAQKDVSVQGTAHDAVDMDIDEGLPVDEKHDEDGVHPLTKKEKQVIRWLEGVQRMVPWYLEIVRVTESLSRVDDVHKLPSRCGDCEQKGRGVKILCLLFTRTQLLLSF
jgi:hypothetical protein